MRHPSSASFLPTFVSCSVLIFALACEQKKPTNVSTAGSAVERVALAPMEPGEIEATVIAPSEAGVTSGREMFAAARFEHMGESFMTTLSIETESATEDRVILTSWREVDGVMTMLPSSSERIASTCTGERSWRYALRVWSPEYDEGLDKLDKWVGLSYKNEKEKIELLGKNMDERLERLDSPMPPKEREFMKKQTEHAPEIFWRRSNFAASKLLWAPKQLAVIEARCKGDASAPPQVIALSAGAFSPSRRRDLLEQTERDFEQAASAPSAK